MEHEWNGNLPVARMQRSGIRGPVLPVTFRALHFALCPLRVFLLISLFARASTSEDRQADLLRGLEIDRQLEFRRLFHRQIGGLGALQDFVHVICGAPVAVREVRPVGRKSAGIYRFSGLVY